MIIWRGMDCAPHDEDILLLPAGKVARYDVEIERFVDRDGYVVEKPTAWACPPKVDWAARAVAWVCVTALCWVVVEGVLWLMQ